MRITIYTLLSNGAIITGLLGVFSFLQGREKAGDAPALENLPASEIEAG